jgi:hypothetical protein
MEHDLASISDFMVILCLYITVHTAIHWFRKLICQQGHIILTSSGVIIGEFSLLCVKAAVYFVVAVDLPTQIAGWKGKKD